VSEEMENNPYYKMLKRDEPSFSMSEQMFVLDNDDREKEL
jgi:hypothetical protein